MDIEEGRYPELKTQIHQLNEVYKSQIIEKMEEVKQIEKKKFAN